MPLSRLTPRSKRATLTRQSSPRVRAGDGQKHIHLWAAIRKTREELHQWQRQVDQVEGLFAEHVVPLEHELTRVTSSISAQLINHFENTDLEIPDKSLLGLWVTDNLNALNDHPFGDAQRTMQLNEQWLQLLNTDGPVENQLARLARERRFQRSLEDADLYAHSEDEPRSQSDETERPGNYADPAQTGLDSKNVAGNPSKLDDKEASVDDHASHGAQQEYNDSTEIDQTIRTLESKLSIDRLFRQLAKVLHPDREQDEQARARKHILMSECLKARQEKDINALLTLYCEHVGELPDDLNNNSHNELVTALEQQLKRLQEDLRTRRFGDPIQTMIVERYSSSSQSECERRIHRHATSLQEEITKACHLDEHLNTRDELLEALDERRALEQDRMSINEMTGF